MTNEQQERLKKLEVKLENKELAYELTSGWLEEKAEEVEKLQKELEYAKGREKAYIEQIHELKNEVDELHETLDLPCDECQVKHSAMEDMEHTIDTLTNLLQRHITFNEPIDYFIHEAKQLLKVKE